MLGSADHAFTQPEIASLAKGEFRARSRADIKGSGYVVRSLEAALWCFDQTHDYASAVLMAANLGDDADTTAAVVGQLAGAHYGIEGIPKDWLARLAMRDEIADLAGKLYALARTCPA